MGLTIHYTLSLPGRTSETNALKKLEALRQRCMDIPLKECDSKLMTFAGWGCNFKSVEQESDNQWFLIQAQRHASYVQDGKHVRLAKPADWEKNWPMGMHSLVPTRIVGFKTWPGEGCEGCNVGLTKAPETFDAQVSQYHEKVVLKTPHAREWFWSSFCKTQYANDPACGGLENFLRCHLSVVAMLDAAIEVGFKVTVRDEGHYWENRSVTELIKQIGSWDRFIAAIGGAFKQIVGDTGLACVGSMDSNKNLEQLEAEGVKQFKDLPLIKLVEQTRKQKMAEVEAQLA